MPFVHFDILSVSQFSYKVNFESVGVLHMHISIIAFY